MDSKRQEGLNTDNMTALVSCFARAYHCKNSESPVFADSIAEKLLTAEEYDTISRNMMQGIQYFVPDFQTRMAERAHRKHDQLGRR